MDVYSYGVLLCKMCIRDLPDTTKRDTQVAQVPYEGFRCLIQRCIQMEPETRPTMEEIIEYLDPQWHKFIVSATVSLRQGALVKTGNKNLNWRNDARTFQEMIIGRKKLRRMLLLY